MKKKIVSLLVMAIVLAGITPLSQTADACVTCEDNTHGVQDFTGVTINVFNWGLFIDEDLIAEFEAETGITVNYSTYSTNEELYTQLQIGGASYDVIVPSDYMIEQLIEEDMLFPLNFNNIPNFQYIDELFLNPAYDPQNAFSVPYAWGITGIIYNSDHVSTPTSWGALWNEDYANRILMFNNPRDAFGVAALYRGDNINDMSDEAIIAQRELLIEQRPLVLQYVMDEIYTLMPAGEAWLAPWYVGSFFYMQYSNPSLRFAIPDEGVNFFVNAMVVPASSRHPEAAEAFINFFTRPDVSGRNMNHVGYSTPVTAAREYIELSDENFALAYPDYEWLRANAFEHMFAFESVEATNRLNDEFRRVRAERNLLPYLIGVPAVVVVLAGLFIAMKVAKKRRAAE
ncbi:MAG: spermidine/putrescine ABC transporter substrate-binding protein [Oscillospiraceae bacterium]|nr:spermidine/putrescine ABC transporter substrate-binding protein [Oscillospiraceae bacterium]